MKNRLLHWPASLLLVGCLLACNANDKSMRTKIILSDGWKVQSSAQANVPGAVLSTDEAVTTDWYAATVPTTVMGVLTTNGVYTDLFEGENYRSVDRTLFDCPWWFRKEFTLAELSEDEHASLTFDGISYAANVWLNGHLVLSRDSLYGPFRQFSIDITPYAKTKNVLAVEVFRAQPGDPNIGFVDWNPRPADESMGIFREVYAHVTGQVSMAHTAVHSKVNTQTLKEAWLTVETQLANLSDEAVDGELTGTMEGVTFSIPVSLHAGETKIVKITPEQVEGLHIANPRLWWCNNLGSPEMYSLDLAFKTNKNVSDCTTVKFGIREIEDYFTPEGHRGFRLNGKAVLVKSAGWTDDLFLRDTPSSNETQVQYVKDMNLNSIRFENIWGNSQNIYDLCDRYGLMALVGWSCHWEWEPYLGSACDEFGGIKSEKQISLIARSLKDQVLWLRNHPSIIAWFVGSDMLPRPELEKRYMSFLPDIDNRPYVSAAKTMVSELTGPSGMKMNGPYEYVGPNYWYIDSLNGGAFGFNTETGIGAQLPVRESIEKMIPADKRWPVDQSVWNYHCTASTSAMNTLDVLSQTIQAKYGVATDLDDYLKKADLLNYEATRAMFEAFRVQAPKATGIVQWMLNSAWPSFYWQLYDYYLVPTAAYYAVKKANMPQQLIYDYKENAVYLVNETDEPLLLTAKYSLYGLNSQPIKEEQKELKTMPGSAIKVFELPHIKDNALLFLQLTDAQGGRVADNLYCLSEQKDEYDWAKTNWIHTPLKSAANFHQLSNLPQTECKVTAASRMVNGNQELEVTLHNSSPQVAFFTRLALKGEQGELLRPVFWEDNYITLLPGQKRVLKCMYSPEVAGKKPLRLTVSGWNQQAQDIVIPAFVY